MTVPLDDKLVKEVRKIAEERDTTLTGLVRTPGRTCKGTLALRTKAQGA